jgi:hypothetical protein
MPATTQDLTVVPICHACEALRHWLLINNQTALQFRLTGHLEHTHEHAPHKAMAGYAAALPHTCQEQ